MSQPTSPEGNPPGYDSCDPGLPTVAELGKGDPAVRAERMSGISLGIAGQMFLWAIGIGVALFFVVLLFQQRH